MTTLSILDRPSPNHDARPDGCAIDMLMMHYTGMETAAAALERMCDPESRVAAHYMIDEDGTTYRLLAEESRGWHAGISFWAGKSGVNDCSVGIELVNPGHEFGYRPFPEPQMAALEVLSKGILSRHPIPPERVIGHSDVAPDRKTDPGELFDWARLARAGIGVWPGRVTPVAKADMAEVARLLAAIGYDIGGDGDTLRVAITAFQRHFQQHKVDGIADGETQAIAAALVP